MSIADRDAGYHIESHRDDPLIEYDRTRFRIERDPATDEQWEKFKIVAK